VKHGVKPELIAEAQRCAMPSCPRPLMTQVPSTMAHEIECAASTSLVGVPRLPIAPCRGPYCPTHSKSAAVAAAAASSSLPPQSPPQQQQQCAASSRLVDAPCPHLENPRRAPDCPTHSASAAVAAAAAASSQQPHGLHVIDQRRWRQPATQASSCRHRVGSFPSACASSTDQVSAQMGAVSAWHWSSCLRRRRIARNLASVSYARRAQEWHKPRHLREGPGWESQSERPNRALRPTLVHAE